jgi:hypothetical protein
MEPPVRKLTFHLQEGFNNDEVQVLSEGRMLFQRTAVTTKRLLGYADVIEVQAAESVAGVVVRVPTHGLSYTFTLPPGGPLHIALSIEAGRVVHRLSESSFGYF